MAEKKGPIRPHPLVEALVPDPGQPPLRTTKLFGYPGRSAVADTTRLWLDLELSAYVDLPNDSVRYSKELPDDGGTWVWVDADAPLQYSSVTSHAAQAEFLAGGITAAALRRAGAAAPEALPISQPPLCTNDISCGAPTFPNRCPTHQGGCPSFNVICPPPTADCPPSVGGGPCPTDLIGCPPPPTFPPGRCPSVFLNCPTQSGCPSVDLPCPTQKQCPSVDLPCATQNIRCPSVFRCPSQAVACPSVQIVCLSQAGNVCPTTNFRCPSIGIVCPTPTRLVNCQSDFTICPSAICPSVAILCETTPGCPIPTFGCPDPEGPGRFG